MPATCTWTRPSLASGRQPWAWQPASRLEPGSRRGRKLELVHISKSGGTALSAAAARAGIAWGACRWVLPSPTARAEDRRSHPMRSACRKARGAKRGLPSRGAELTSALARSLGCVTAAAGGSVRMPPWHVPPSCVRGVYEDADLFTSVRHPYSRAVSEYNCPHTGARDGPKAGEANSLNGWLLERLREGSRGCSHSLLPQHLYLHASPNHSVVVLRYESLEADARRLFAAYGLPVHFSAAERVNSRGSGNGRGRLPRLALTAANLSRATRRAIFAVARWDFELFGYEP